MAERHSNGGRARAAALSPQERRDIAHAAAKARWSQNGPQRVEGPVEVLPSHQPNAARKRLDRAVRKARTAAAELTRIAADATATAEAINKALEKLESRSDP